MGTNFQDSDNFRHALDTSASKGCKSTQNLGFSQYAFIVAGLARHLYNKTGVTLSGREDQSN
jgi:hypothetical protein